MSVPQANWSWTSDCPSRDRDEMRRAPGIEYNCCSMGSVMKRSTSAGPASEYVVHTESVGKATSGRRSMGSRRNDTTPSTAMPT